MCGRRPDGSRAGNDLCHLDATIVLERAILNWVFTGSRPAGLNFARLGARDRGPGALRCGARSAEVASALQGPAGHHCDPRWTSFRRRTKSRWWPHARSRVPEPAVKHGEVFTGVRQAGPGGRKRFRGFKEILERSTTTCRRRLYMKGTIQEIRQQSWKGGPGLSIGSLPQDAIHGKTGPIIRNWKLSHRTGRLLRGC